MGVRQQQNVRQLFRIMLEQRLLKAKGVPPDTMIWTRRMGHPAFFASAADLVRLTPFAQLLKGLADHDAQFLQVVFAEFDMEREGVRFEMNNEDTRVLVCENICVDFGPDDIGHAPSPLFDPTPISTFVAQHRNATRRGML